MNSSATSREDILSTFDIFRGGTGGLDSWLEPDTPEIVLDVLADIENQPLSRARFNQLLTIAQEAPVSEALFRYYWLSEPSMHPYDVRNLPSYSRVFAERDEISSLDQLYWGLYRFYVDALLYFGNIRTAFQRLRQLSIVALEGFFRDRCIATADIAKRGEPIQPGGIAKDNRYLISEMVCKSFEAESVPQGQLAKVLIEQYQQHRQAGGGQVTVRQLLTGAYKRREVGEQQSQLDLSAGDIMDEVINDKNELLSKVAGVARKFEDARAIALKNTEIYLSMVGDLDVYVATSMKTRQDFRNMADFCEDVFGHPDLNGFNLRYFDPTLSAAAHHEDKGLIECLMVKCAKVLLLQAGSRDSYGKDAEAAMALSLGKPVIIHADEDYRSRFFRDIHPLSRLINFDNGVAIGAMIATSTSQVVELLKRILSNSVEYELSQQRPKYLVLKEKLTNSVVRLQTSDDLLRETFWNHYHNDAR